MDLRITCYSHYFSVFGYTARGREYRSEFTRQFIEKGLTKVKGRFVQENKKVYARRDLKREEACFHINVLDRFISGIKTAGGFSPLQYEMREAPMYEPEFFKFDWNEDFQPWEYQVPIIDYCVEPGIQKIITAQAGSGKTMMSLYAMKQLGVRTAVITLGGFEDRWVPEFYEKLKLDPSEVRSCCGCQKLYRLLREVKEKGIPNVKAIFISTATIRDFVKNWNNGKVIGSGCEDIDPATLWEFLGVGLRIIDEAHKEFHGHFIGDCHSHVPKTIYLTATLFANVPFMDEMYSICFPKRLRKEVGKINVYVDLVKTCYNLKDGKKARFIGGQGSYSHTTYEAWIMSNGERLHNYLDSIYNYAKQEWTDKRRPDHKLLIFCATIELCQRFRDYFQKKEPSLIVNSYTSGDDYQILLDSHIIFSTVGKSGTAVDIPDLTQAYLTVALDAPNANIQALGRLRELKGEKKFPQSYHAFVCLQIDKHNDYWTSKEKLFKNRVKSITTKYLDRRI